MPRIQTTAVLHNCARSVPSGGRTAQISRPLTYSHLSACTTTIEAHCARPQTLSNGAPASRPYGPPPALTNSRTHARTKSIIIISHHSCSQRRRRFTNQHTHSPHSRREAIRGGAAYRAASVESLYTIRKNTTHNVLDVLQ